MMSKVYRIINSKNKKNIRLVALGSFQIELFEIDDDEYFCVYRYTNDQSCHMLVALKSAGISILGDGFQILDGNKSYKILVKKSDGKVKVNIVEYLWGWLPFQRFAGKVSDIGLSTLSSGLSSRVNSIV
ncbi:hypothetical protein TDB9533_04801 [Thalassocella blandensis]|nr:hypothetical protein TDB9533_04801 [Thalassocella blandensis]